jgi:hypothetical protein
LLEIFKGECYAHDLDGPCVVGEKAGSFVPTFIQKGVGFENGVQVRQPGKPKIFNDTPTWETGSKFSASTAKAGAFFCPLKEF